MKSKLMACGLMVALAVTSAMVFTVNEDVLAQGFTTENPTTSAVITNGVVVIDGIAVPGLTTLDPDQELMIRNGRANGTADSDTVKAINAATAGAAKSDDPDVAATAAAAAAATANATAAAAAAQAATKMPSLSSFSAATKTTMTAAGINNLMSQGTACMSHHWSPGPQKICCQGPCPCSGHGCPCRKTGCLNNKVGSEFNIDYWEASEVIEVSCRQGFSMLKPGLGGRSILQEQSCIGANKPGNSRWFFEARVWAINGGDGELRHQAMGGTAGEQQRQCSEIGPSDTKKSNAWGYGATKWASFTPGSASGPGGSWEAYISDKDEAWANDTGGLSSAPKPTACTGGVNMAGCWGALNATGWVSHPNPRIAAALVAWRAHTKALGMKKVSAANGEGYQMMMDYPFVTYSGAYGAGMGMTNGAKKGSKCFKPGDGGPDWWGGLQPTAVPAMVQKLTSGTLSSVAETNPGVYIFTVWVKTKCERWDVNPPGPAGICVYKDKS